jgi:endogenous inhibitor of DNA gyrase (YacG/DUF329 family)
MWVCPDCGKPVAPDTFVLHHENCADRKAKAFAPGVAMASNGNVKAICPDCNKLVAGNAWSLHHQHCAG